MSITARSSLRQVTAEVGKALRSAGIRAVLTGGACAAIYTGDEYRSEDVDLIIQSAPSQLDLDEAMGTIGFVRSGDHYAHPDSDFFVEFPRGPLSLGADQQIRPVYLKLGKVAVLALSATDSCRDRLAAFFHWNDRQSLETAVAIAARNSVRLSRIRAWAAEERSLERFEEFLQELKLRKRSVRKPVSGRLRPRSSRS